MKETERGVDMKETERQAQRAVVQYVRLKYPSVLIWAIPNGGSRNKIEASNLKKDGVLAGVPDLFVAMPSKDCGGHTVRQGSPVTCACDYFFGLFIEMKSEHGKLSEAQIDVANKLSEAGYKCEACYSSEEAINVIDDYLRWTARHAGI